MDRILMLCMILLCLVKFALHYGVMHISNISLGGTDRHCFEVILNQNSSSWR